MSAKSDGDNDASAFIRVVQNTTASPTALANGDYDQIGSIDNPTAGASDTDITNIATSTYLSIPLNATGLSWISKTGHTKLGLREGHDATDVAPTNNTNITGIEIRTTNYTGTGSDPILEVTYETGGGGGGGTTSTTTAYFHGDHLGGMNVMSDGTGQTVLEVADYYPYGASRISTGSFKEQRKYAGTERDAELSLDYMVNRYYSAARGQFLSQDPVHLAIGNPNRVAELTRTSQQQLLVDPQLLNSYAYGRNNPLQYKDSEGNVAVIPAILMAARIYGAFSLGFSGGEVLNSELLFRNDYSDPKRSNALFNFGFGLVTAAGGTQAKNLFEQLVVELAPEILKGVDMLREVGAQVEEAKDLESENRKGSIPNSSRSQVSGVPGGQTGSIHIGGYNAGQTSFFRSFYGNNQQAPKLDAHASVGTGGMVRNVVVGSMPNGAPTYCSGICGK